MQNGHIRSGLEIIFAFPSDPIRSGEDSELSLCRKTPGAWRFYADLFICIYIYIQWDDDDDNEYEYEYERIDARFSHV